MRKGHIKSAEWIKKISEANKGKTNSRKGMIFVPLEEQRIRKNAYRKAWREKNRDRLNELARIKADENKEKINANAREWYRENKDKELARIRFKKYGIDRDTFVEMSEAQGNVCLICKSKTDINLSVDHNHLTGKIRGLICNSCNIGIAKAKDSPTILRAMADYLEKYDG